MAFETSLRRPQRLRNRLKWRQRSSKACTQACSGYPTWCALVFKTALRFAAFAFHLALPLSLSLSSSRFGGVYLTPHSSTMLLQHPVKVSRFDFRHKLYDMAYMDRNLKRMIEKMDNKHAVNITE